jgi:hypothetical protein
MASRPLARSSPAENAWAEIMLPSPLKPDAEPRGARFEGPILDLTFPFSWSQRRDAGSRIFGSDRPQSAVRPRCGLTRGEEDVHWNSTA